MCLFASPSGIGNTQYKFGSWLRAHWSKTPTVGVPGKGSTACQLRHPNKFRMADPVRPLYLGMVSWFGSLEFMSLGHEYDMVLLPPRTPSTDDDIMHKQPRRRRHPGRRSHRARQARCEQDHPDTAQSQGDALRSTGIPCPTVGTRSLVGDLSGLSLGRGKTPVTCSDAPSSSSAPPPPEELTPAEQGPAMAPSPYPSG